MALALTGLAIWDGRSARTDPGPVTIRIEGGRIAAIGAEPGLARGAEVRALDGATALPGLMDAHVHLVLDPEIASPEEQLRVPASELVPRMESRALAMVRAGITTARDLGGGAGHELRLRDRIARGEIPGPRLLCAGQPVTSPRGHCWFWGGEASDDAELRAVVARQLAAGADWIKVMATGGMLTRGSDPLRAQFDVARLRIVVAAARAGGRRVAAHCHGTAGIRNAVAAGVATLEHCSFSGGEGFGSDFDPGLPAQIAARGIRVSPTVNAGWGRRARQDGSPTRFAERMTTALRGLRAAGVDFVAGTDAGIPNVAHDRLAEGLAVLAQLAALEPVEALRCATSGAADALGIAAETGALEPGLAADVLVVEGDPLADLAALRRVRLVVAQGRPVDA